MKTSRFLQSMLAGVAVISFLIYALACSTSFSPDDRQVIYPSFDPHNGETSVMLYDRATKRTETLLTSTRCELAAERKSVLIRAEWLPNGKGILVGQLVDNSTLLLTVIPRDTKGPVRNFMLPNFDETGVALQYPFAIVGNQLFLNGNKSAPLRLDLLTGEMHGGQTNKNPVLVLPTPDGKSLVGLQSSKTNTAAITLGTFDPEKMEFKPTATMIADQGDNPLPCFNPADGRVVWITEKDNQLNLQVLKGEKIELNRPLILPSGKLKVGPFLVVSRDGKTAYTAACTVTEEKTNSEYGLLEIPLSDTPLRFTPLFRADYGDDGDLIFAQPSLSHDGKTWAICSSYLFRQNHSLRPEDCALYLVDVSKANRPVTKVPISVPPQPGKLVH